MNGGKKTRVRREYLEEDFDENSCPNASKRRKTEEPDGCLKPINENTITLTELTSSSGSDSDYSKDGEGALDLGFVELVDDDSYTTAESDDKSSVLCSDLSSDSNMTTKYKNTEISDDSSPDLLNIMVTPENKTSDFTLSRKIRLSEGRADHFSRLSDEIILMIFSWLPKTVLCKGALVCKRWRQIAYDDTLWNRLDLGRRILLPRNLEHVVKRGVSILRLTVSHIPDPVIKPNSTFLPINFVSRLQYLDLSSAQISVEGLNQLLRICRNLRKLSIENCRIDQKVCESIGQNASLEALNLSGCLGLKSNGLEAILACCTSLISLNLGWTSMDSETLLTLSTTLPSSVQRLSVAGCRKSLSNDHVIKIISRCAKLVELDLSDCTAITSTSVSAIISGLSNLEHLSLSRCYNILPSDFERLSESPSLVYIDVFGVLNEANLNVMRKCLSGIFLNKFMFTSIARPTVGVRRTSIWGLRVRD